MRALLVAAALWLSPLASIACRPVHARCDVSTEARWRRDGLSAACGDYGREHVPGWSAALRGDASDDWPCVEEVYQDSQVGVCRGYLRQRQVFTLRCGPDGCRPD